MFWPTPPKQTALAVSGLKGAFCTLHLLSSCHRRQGLLEDHFKIVQCFPKVCVPAMVLGRGEGKGRAKAGYMREGKRGKERTRQDLGADKVEQTIT